MNDDLEDEVVSADEGFDEFSKKSGVADKLRGSPAAKVGIVLVAVAAIVGVMLLFGEKEAPPEQSSLPTPSEVSSAPGATAASPAYVNAVEQQNEQVLEDAIKKGESAIPVPTETQQTRLELPQQEEKSEDPLHRWRQMQEERVDRDLHEQDAVEAVTVLDSQQQADAVKQMSDKMTEQMQSILSKTVEEKKFSYVGVMKKDTHGEAGAAGTTGTGTAGAGASGGAGNNFEADTEKEVLIPSGEIEYAQTLIEANSDIQGPVLAQMLTGPLKGSRLIGTFSVAEEDYLVLNFTTAVKDGKDVDITAIALDPDTSLAGMATDVDHRYFRRIVMPAAAAFVKGFASAVSETGRTDVIVSGGTTGTGAVTTETAPADDEQRVATGVEEAATEISSIIKDMGEVETLVVIKAGTPVGVLFTEPVYKEEEDI